MLNCKWRWCLSDEVFNIDICIKIMVWVNRKLRKLSFGRFAFKHISIHILRGTGNITVNHSIIIYITWWIIVIFKILFEKLIMRSLAFFFKNILWKCSYYVLVFGRSNIIDPLWIKYTHICTIDKFLLTSSV